MHSTFNNTHNTHNTHESRIGAGAIGGNSGTAAALAGPSAEQWLLDNKWVVYSAVQRLHHSLGHVCINQSQARASTKLEHLWNKPGVAAAAAERETAAYRARVVGMMNKYTTMVTPHNLEGKMALFREEKKCILEVLVGKYGPEPG